MTVRTAFVAPFLALALAASAPPAAAKPPPTIFVLGLRGEGVPPSTLDALGEVMAAEAAKTGRYTVLSRADVRARVEIERRHLTDRDVDLDARLADIGGALGAERVLAGSLSRVGTEWIVAIHLTDVKSVRSAGRGIGRTGAGVEGLFDAVRFATREAFGAPAPGETPGGSADAALEGRLLALLRGLGPPNWEETMRRIAGEGPAAVPVLLRLLNDPSAAVRAGAADAIGRIQPEERSAIPSLKVLALKDESRSVRICASMALMRLAPVYEMAAYSALLSAARQERVDREEDRMREDPRGTRRGGGEVRTVYDVLAAALEDPRDRVRKWARVILGQVGGVANPPGGP